MKILIATTGLSKPHIHGWKELSQKQGNSILFAPNTSLGILLTMHASLQMASLLLKQKFDIEMTEAHHRNKIDAPSGTVKFLAEQIAKQENLSISLNRTSKREDNELGIASIRGGSVFGEHTVHFMGEFEEISITHKALSRSLFAKGALTLGRWLMSKSAGQYGLGMVTPQEMISIMS